MKVMSLRTRYLTLFTTLSITLMIMFSLAVYGELQRLHQSVSDISQSEIEHSLTSEVIQRATTALASVGREVASEVYQNQLTDFDNEVLPLKSEPLYHQVLIYDREDKILYDDAGGFERIGHAVSQALPVRIALDAEGVRQLSDQLLLNQPVYYQGERVGGVLLWLSLEPVQRAVAETELAISDVLLLSEQQFVRFLFYLLIAFALIALILGALISYSISRPVNALMDYSQRLALGKWDLPPLLSKDDEFGRLGSAFRNMAIQIRNNVRNIEQLAFNDALTESGNRTFFEQKVDEYITDHPGSSLTLLQLDLDNFKWFNETRGLHAGDELLKKVAQHCRSVTKEWSDQWAFSERCIHFVRFGGDEFGITLLGPISRHGVECLNNRLLELFNPPAGTPKVLHGMQASIGVACYPEDGMCAAEIQNHATIALNEAKRRGKNRVVYFEDEMNARLQRHYELEQALQGAKSRDELYMIYQPQVSLDTGKVIGYEALMRWNHSALGFVSPGEFFPVAEQSPVVQELGEFVIEQVIRDIPRLCREHGHPVKVSLNVSAAQFFYHNVAELVLQGVKQHKIAPETLSIELTETALLEKDDVVIEQLLRLRAAGLTIMLDDFGTGYASLSYLKEFPVSGLKIDRSYTARLCSGEKADFALFESLLFLARNLGLNTVVEGIENEHEEMQAKLAGALVAQGFRYGRGLPIEEQLAEIAREKNEAHHEENTESGIFSDQ